MYHTKVERINISGNIKDNGNPTVHIDMQSNLNIRLSVIFPYLFLYDVFFHLRFHGCIVCML